MALNDLTGKRFNNYVVLERAENSPSGKVRWKCQCNCGKTHIVEAFKLTHGIRKMCPTCARKGGHNMIDETGNKYGKLTVISEAGSNSRGKQLWNCVCDCGNTHVVSGIDLRSGEVKSCGCLKTDPRYDKRTNLIGQRFGSLVVIDEAEDSFLPSGGRQVNWLCRCDCGTEKIIRASHLTTGEIVSCGCIISKGELKIKQILNDNHIDFIPQQTFPDCRFEDTNYLAFFDFYIPNKNYVIEYDGKQHFKEPSDTSNRKKSLSEIQAHDEFKNNWCRKNSIEIIRIPYTHYNDLNIGDLLLETSNFKLVS